MLTRRIIPCLDVSGGRVVKGVKFQGLRDAGDPLERALVYQQQGADELVILDVSATIEERKHQTEVVAAIRSAFMLPVTVGGGVRSAQDAERLLTAGADKVGVNTAAVNRPDLLDEMGLRFGAQCTILAVDARRPPGRAAGAAAAWEVMINAGKTPVDRDAIAWIREAVDRGAGEILLTSWDRDGTREGYDLELLAAASDAVPVPIIASGGADHAQHMKQAFDAGADAVLAASIFHESNTTVATLKDELAALGVEVRR